LCLFFSLAKESQVKLQIHKNDFCIVQRATEQYSQKKESAVLMVWLKLFRFFKPAGLTTCIFSLFIRFVSVAHLEFPSKLFGFS
jgi:hypothetical protein